MDSHWSIILPFLTSAFGVFLLRQFFLTLPQDLIDAGKIDGAGAWTIYWRIALPLAGPALAALAILTFNSTWNNYLLPAHLPQHMGKDDAAVGHHCACVATSPATAHP